MKAAPFDHTATITLGHGDSTQSTLRLAVGSRCPVEHDGNSRLPLAFPLRLSRGRTLADDLVFSSIEIVPALITKRPHSMPSVKRFTPSV